MKLTMMLMAAMTSMVVIKVVKNFSNKLMVIIMMEFLFLMALTFQTSMKTFYGPAMTMLYITIFMVLDSTVGISILMASSRNSYHTMNQFSNI